MTIHRITSLAAVSLALALSAPGCREEHASHDAATEHAEHDEHAGHDDHDEHAGEGPNHVELTAEQRARIGLELATAGPGSIARESTFPGEIVLNPDQVAHVVPRAAGVVRQVLKTLGDTVAADEVLAWIESADLAEAKLTLYAKEAEVGRCTIALPRARAIFENVNRLLALLDSDPSDDELGSLAGLEMGEYRGRLLTAHAEFVAARQEVARESGLREKGISRAQDLTGAQTAYRLALAEFNASRDAARYEVFVAFGEAARLRQVAEFDAVAAEQSLRLKGVDEQVIQALRGLVPKTAGLAACECAGPECEHNRFPSVRDQLGKDERLGWYALRAPFAGVVIEKHLSLGEMAGEDESVFAVADTSTVWVNLSVFQKDLASIEPGQAVSVDLASNDASHAGVIADVAPLVDPGTRTARARVVLANADDALRPGLFVTVRVALATVEAGVVVPRAAVQILEQRDVVFIAVGDGFEPVPVVLGHGDGDVVEITGGLEPGQQYVSQGAFELKAKVATSGLGAHAGHGH